MRQTLARPRNAVPAQEVRALTYDAFLRRTQAASRRGGMMDALLADLFVFCQRVDRAIGRALGALFTASARKR